MSSAELSSSESSASDYESDDEQTLMISTGSSRKSMMASFAKRENVQNVDFTKRNEKSKNNKISEQPAKSTEFKNKQRVMLLCSRGITYR